MNLIRLKGWRERMDEYVSAQVLKPYSKKDFECSRFTSEVIEQITGMNLGAPYLAKFDDEESALKLIETFDTKTVLGEVDSLFSRYGIERCTWKQQLKGDPCYFELGPIKALAINMGAQAITPSIRGGYQNLPLPKALACWHIK